jgi:transposase
MTGKYHRMTGTQLEGIAKYLPVQRKREIKLRDVMDSILFIVCTGIQWRNLPKYFPKWNAVYYYFQKWTVDQTLFRINAGLNELDRINKGKESKPSLLLVDSQSVKLAPMIGDDRGFDGHKKINGRKRQLLTDTDGCICDTCAHTANLYDADGAILRFDENRM